FFFSSRRRHTRFSRDWSSDVCSSDLEQFADPEQAVTAYNRTQPAERRQDMLSALLTIRDQTYVRGDRLGTLGFCAGGGNVFDLRSEERRIGRGWRCGWCLRE